MLGVNLLVRLGRSLLAGPLADAGVLPAGYYRHLALAAMEEEDFPEALNHLRWAHDPLLVQVLVLRLRLLAARHARQAQALGELLKSSGSQEKRAHYQALLTEENLARELLGGYEAQALEMLV